MLDKNGVITWRLTPQAAQIVLNAVAERPLKEVLGLHQDLMQQSQPESEAPEQRTVNVPVPPAGETPAE